VVKVVRDEGRLYILVQVGPGDRGEKPSKAIPPDALLCSLLGTTAVHAWRVTFTVQRAVCGAQKSVSRGVVELNECLSVKGAEETLNKPHAFGACSPLVPSRERLATRWPSP
jgi:hypothetical protein